MLPTLILAAAISTTPAAAVDAAVLDLQTIPAEQRHSTRYLSLYPIEESRREQLESVLLFWLPSLSWRREPPSLGRSADKLLYRINLDEWGWTPEAWEELGKADPYLSGSWVDPVSRNALYAATGSYYPVLRADWFIARTSLDVGGQGFLKGYYSRFLGLPATEKELFELLLIPAQDKRFNYLLRGGSVLSSPVALHNRELQLMPSFYGSERAKYFWKSFDADGDVGKKSVIEQFRGSLEIAGGEHIWSLPNGLQGYYLINAEGGQLGEVPQEIAQNRSQTHDVTVRNPYSCVRCHAQGINHFDDVVKRTMLSDDVGLAVIAKDYKPDLKEKVLLEEYYLSDLGQAISQHQEAYTEAVERCNGLSPQENADAYSRLVEGYYWGKVTQEQAALDCGCSPEEIKELLKRSGNAHALALLAGTPITREAWESAFADVMYAQQYEWKVQDATLPPGAERLIDDRDPPGSVRYRLDGQTFYRSPRGLLSVWDGSQWVRR